MKKILIPFCIFVFAVSVFLQPALAGQTSYAIDESRSLIEFSFKSTLHGIEGKAHHFKGVFENDLHSGSVDIDVASLDTDNPKRDKHMFEMFDLTDYANIHCDISEIMPDASITDGGNHVILKGELTIRDQKQPIEIPAVINKTEGGVTLSGDADLSLKSFDLKPPSVLMLIRVFDTIHVHFETLLKKVAS